MSNVEVGGFEVHKKHNFVIELLEKKLSRLLMCCNEFLIHPPEKSKREIGYLRLCLSCFITFTCAGLHIGILLPSFFICHHETDSGDY